MLFLHSHHKRTLIIASTLLLVIGALYFLFIHDKKEIPLITEAPNIKDVRCYAHKSNSAIPSYELIRLVIFNDYSTEGELSYRIGDQHVSGTFEGEYMLQEGLFDGIYTVITPEDTYQEERILKQSENGILFGYGEVRTDETGMVHYRNPELLEFDHLVEIVACERYDALQEESALR